MVTDMKWMFAECTLSEGFSLGELFDTRRVTDMFSMFNDCSMPKGFSLGEGFNIDRVLDMRRIFDGCTYNGVNVYEYFKTQDEELVIYRLKELNQGEQGVL